MFLIFDITNNAIMNPYECTILHVSKYMASLVFWPLPLYGLRELKSPTIAAVFLSISSSAFVIFAY